MAEKQEQVDAWVKENPIIERWLENLAESTKTRYKMVVFRYFSWLKDKGYNCNPEELISLQKQAIGEDRYKQLDKIQDWVRSLPNTIRVSTKQMMYSCVRSFYAYRRAELPRDKAFKIRSTTAPVEGVLNIEGLKKIILSSNLLYQAVFTTMFQSGMGWQQFQHFNEVDGWQQIQKHIFKEDHKPILIRLPARKHGGRFNHQPFYTFIGHDAQDLIRRYIKTQRGKIGDEPIFLNEKGKPLQRSDARKFFTRHAKACGLISEVTPLCPECAQKTRRTRQKVNGKHKIFYECECGVSIGCDDPKLQEFRESFRTVRHGMNLHELRDVFRSTWEISHANSSLAEFCLGHEIDRNEYNKFYRNKEFTTAEYKKAEPYLNLLSEEPGKIKRVDMETEIEKRVEQKVAERTHLATKEKIEQHKRVQGLEQQIKALVENGKRKEKQIQELHVKEEENKALKERMSQAEKKLEEIEEIKRQVAELTKDDDG